MAKKPKKKTTSRALAIRKPGVDHMPYKGYTIIRPTRFGWFFYVLLIILAIGAISGVTWLALRDKPAVIQPPAIETPIPEPTATMTPEPTATPTEIIRKVSMEGRKLIKIFESLSLVPYNDAGGRCTIGYGHFLYDALCSSDTPISLVKAEKLFDSDIENVEYILYDDLEDIKLNQCQYDALASFVFNVGDYVWHRSSVYLVVRFGEFEEVSIQLMNYVYPRGGGKPLASLEFRRRAEGRLWDECRYRPGT